MRFVVMGVGAVGGVVAARLAQHGHDVATVARGAHQRAIASHGLRLESPDDTTTAWVEAVDDPRLLDRSGDDVVLLAVKSQQTVAALNQLAEAFPASTPIVCLQNGVQNERAALRRFANVYGVPVMLPSAHLQPGVVQAFSSPTTGILDVGRYPAGNDELAATISASFARSSFVSQPRDDIMRWKHSKLLMNLGNAIEALCGPAARGSELAARAREEGEACLRAAGLPYVPLDEEIERRGSHITLRPVGTARRGGGSTWQSLERRTGSVETDYLNGEVVLLGRLHGIPTPVNALLQARTTEASRTGAAPESCTLDDLAAEL